MSEAEENYDDDEILEDDQDFVEDDESEDFSSLGDLHRHYESFEEPEAGMPHPDNYRADQQERYEKDVELAQERQRGQAFGQGIARAGEATVSFEEEAWNALGPEDRRKVRKISEVQAELADWEEKAASSDPNSQRSRECKQRARRCRQELVELGEKGLNMDKAARRHHSAGVGQDILKASTFDSAAFKPAVQAIESAIDDYNRETEDNKLFAVIKRQSGFEHGSALAPHFDGRDICEIDFSNRPELIGMAEDKTGDDLIDYALKNGLTITRVSLDLDKWGKPVVKKASEQDTVAKTPAKKFLSPLAIQVNAGIFGGGK